MKNVLKSILLAGAVFCASQSFAQHVVKKTTRAVGHKTSEIASKGASVVVDRRYKGKYGPHGETIYIDKRSRYYYVNKTGHHAYLKKVDLMNWKRK